MSTDTILLEKPRASLADKQPVAARLIALRSWLLCWEIYLIVFVAAFLRLYQFNTTEFDPDEVAFFQMARYAVTHGFIPATSNRASVGYFIPPATIDILMIPAAFTNDPLWGAITTAILMTASVFLTYCFVRCYYGRAAGTIAALLYATLFRAVVYSRFIWNVNFLPFFIVLFFIALFWGVVARRKGWLFPALFLLGILIQLHTSGAMLIIPFVVALALAPGTLRWRDLVRGLLSLFIIYFPYLIWEIATQFSDIHLMIQTFLHPQQKPVFDDQAWVFYQDLLNPYNLLSQQNPLHWHNILPYLGETSMLWQLAPYLAWICQLLIYLVVISVVTALILAVWAWGPSSTKVETNQLRPRFSINTQKGHSNLLAAGPCAPWVLRLWDKYRLYRDQASQLVVIAYLLRLWGYVRRYWLLLLNSPYRCGLIILLSWQIIPIVVLLRHSLLLYLHYFIVLMPGPCILVGIFLAKTADAIKRVPTNHDQADIRNTVDIDSASDEHDTQRAHGKSGPSMTGNKLSVGLPGNLYPKGIRLPSVRVQFLVPAVRYGIYALATLIIVAQFIGSTIGILDIDQGNYSDGIGHRYSIGNGSMATYGYNDLQTLRNALTEADQLAQRDHLNRVYVSTAGTAHMEAQLRFLSTQMHTPTTMFNSSCITFPSTAEGPAVMLMEPYNNFATALVTQFATATLIDKPKRPGGAPFWLYIVTPKPVQAVPHAQLSTNNGYDLQFDASSQHFSFNHIPWIVTRWSLLHSVPPSDDTTYTYRITMTHFLNRSHYASTTNQCTFTAIRAGDQVLIPFNQNSLFTANQKSTSSTVTVNGQFYEVNPLYVQFASFRFLSFATIATQKETLYTPEHKVYLTTRVPILARPSNKHTKK
ncbi:MAG TPA: glycosyltransferase family 39 protein [Ktedonobacteraceae bacterium]